MSDIFEPLILDGSKIKGNYLFVQQLSFGKMLPAADALNDCLGGFHLHLLVFPFVYQFNSKIGVLVHPSFAND